jgi:hypothetical protein
MNLKLIIVRIAVLTFPLHAGAAQSWNWPKAQWEQFHCAKQWQTYFATLGAPSALTWTSVGSTSFQEDAYRSRLKFGEWIELTGNSATQQIKASLHRSQEIQNVTFDSSCGIQKQNTKPNFVESTKTEKLFTDNDLEKLLQSKKRGLIYLWSPRMPYSVTDFKKFRKAADRMHLDFIPLLAPNVPLSEALEALKVQKVEFKGQKMASLELRMLNGDLHYPSFFVFGFGALNPKRIVGIFKNDDFDEIIQLRIRELNK